MTVSYTFRPLTDHSVLYDKRGHPELKLADTKLDGWGRAFIESEAAFRLLCILNGAESTKDRVDMHELFGPRSNGYSRIYQAVVNPEVLQDPHIKLKPILGFAPNGLPHLGHFPHISAQRDLQFDGTRLVSFNDLEARVVRGATEEEVLQNASHFIDLLKLNLGDRVEFEMRTQVPELMVLYNNLRAGKIVGDDDYRRVYGKSLTTPQQQSLCLQTAAYLWRSIQDPTIVPVSFNGIEEMKRMKWINFVAKERLGLPGGLFFISKQVPGFDFALKMGKSNPEGSLKYGDSLTGVVERIEALPDAEASVFLLATAEFLFNRQATSLPEETDVEELKQIVVKSITEHNQDCFPLSSSNPS